MNVPDPYAARLAKLRRGMKKAGLAALLVSRPENRRYLSGFTAADSQLDESSGFLLITRGRQILLTDFRYLYQGRKEAPGYEIIIYLQGSAKTAAGLMKRWRIKRLGFEEDYLTCKVHRLLKEEVGDGALEPAQLVEKLRVIKDQAEVKNITRAVKLTEAALAQTFKFLKPGLTEKEAARYLEGAMISLGAEGPAFETIVASGPNAALPHAVPTGRKIRAGETIIFDCGAKFSGYGADMTRTVVLGQPPRWIKKIYQTVRRAQLEAVRAIKPGVKASDIDDLARKIISQAGYGDHFGHALGHGVGLATHEAPSLSKTSPAVLEPGMIVTVEPGIYLEGRGGVRLEQMVLVTDKEARVLNRDQTFYDWSD
ncbi:MAG: Xaa-Pro peptidase family protein [Pseudomonadota bacterium]